MLVLSATPSCAEPVVLSAAEADSVMAAMDRLEVGLWECREQARVDSTLAAAELAIYERALDEQRGSWLDRLLADPRLWFVLGAWVGLQVAD